VRHKKKIVISILLLLIILTSSYFIWDEVSYYQAIIQENSEHQILNELRGRFESNLTLMELYNWEHEHLNYTEGNIQRNTNSIKILEYGKGRCGEFAILYMTLCLAHGYQCRLVSDYFGDHVWTQIEVDGEWVHFDPSAKPDSPSLTNPLVYEQNKKSPVYLILAFEETTFEDVTSNYKNGFWINIISFKMVCTFSIILFLFFFIITWSEIRKRLYKLYFGIGKCRNSIGKFYESNLHLFYGLRFLFMFFLPTAIAGIFLENIQQELFLNTFLAGFTLVVFSGLQVPALTKPKMFITVIENCKNKDKCQYRDDKKGICKFIKDKSCKRKEHFVEIAKGETRLITFRFANLSLHTLKNCVVVFTFPSHIELIHDKNSYDDIDFKKKFQFQKINNALRFSSKKDYLTAPPQECLAYPIIIKAKGEENSDKEKNNIKIEIFSETTWASTIEDFPIVYS
jgi:hypothetical protein